MGLYQALKLIFGPIGRLFVAAFSLLKASKFYRIILITVFVILPHYDKIIGVNPIGLVVAIGQVLGQADQILLDQTIVLITTGSILDRGLAILLIIHAITTIGWYFYAWYWLGNRFVYADVYIWLTGIIIFVLLFIIGHMDPATFDAPFEGLITLLENLDKVASWDTIIHGANESEVRTWYANETDRILNGSINGTVIGNRTH